MTYSVSRLKLSANDEGIFDSSDAALFDQAIDTPAPPRARDLIDQAFQMNASLGDQTTEASPPAVNPSLTANLMGMNRTDPLSGPASTTDEMGDGQGLHEHDVLAAYDAGRFAALEKYAFTRASGSHLPGPASKSTAAGGTPKPVATIPAAPSVSSKLVQDQSNAGVAQASTHTRAFNVGEPAPTPVTAGAPEPMSTNTAELFKPAGPQAVQPPPGAKTGSESLPVRSEYGKREPLRYAIPADNGQTYTPPTNLNANHSRREVSKAFSDLNNQRNADTLNEMGQAAVGSMG